MGKWFRDSKNLRAIRIFLVIALMTLAGLSFQNCGRLKINGARFDESTLGSTVIINGPPLPPEKKIGPIVSQIAMGDGFGCAVINSNLYCWGDNYFFQLADAFAVNFPSPTKLAVLGEGIEQVATGRSHTCVVISGIAKCWGRNNFGQLGMGTISAAPREAPTDVVGLVDVKQISAGNGFTCAIEGTGAKCWGDGSAGRLGTLGTTTATPRDVSGLTTGVDAIATGDSHACALVSGSVKCWGSNAYGQLGTAGTPLSSNSPVPVPGLTGVTAIFAGRNQTCALVGNTPYCWGENAYGKLGFGNTNPANIPTPVAGIPDPVEKFALGREHGCALTTTSKVYCYGYNLSAQVGIGNTASPQLTPKEVVFPEGPVTQLSAGWDHNCAVAGGQVYCWGTNTNGEIGTGSTSDILPVSSPTKVYGDF